MLTMLTKLRRLLPIAVLLTLGIPGLYAQLDCGHPVDVKLTPSANVTFQGSSGETVYIRLLVNSVDPGFTLNAPVVADPFGNLFNARARNLVPGQVTAGATPIDLAGSIYSGESFTGWEFDLNTDGTSPHCNWLATPLGPPPTSTLCWRGSTALAPPTPR